MLKLDLALSGPTVGLSSQPKFGLSQPCSTFLSLGFDLDFDRERGFVFVVLSCFLSPMHMPSQDTRLNPDEELCVALSTWRLFVRVVTDRDDVFMVVVVKAAMWLLLDMMEEICKARPGRCVQNVGNAIRGCTPYVRRLY